PEKQRDATYRTNVTFVCTDLAWLLATTEHKTRNAAEAVVRAERATQLSPEFGRAWTALGAARYRAGDWQRAAAALQKSLQLRKGNGAAEELFLAMAHGQLGEKEKAR